jgi:hypothetical protein
MHLLVQWFLISTLDAVAGHRLGGPVAISSPSDTGHVAARLTFLFRR